MDKKKIELILTGILVVVLILILTNSIKKVSKSAASFKGQEVSAPFSTRKVEPLLAAKKVEAKKREKPVGWGRDPFVLHEISPGEVSTISSLKLMGITTGKNKKAIAIINNEMVSVGSKVGAFKVIKISKDSVIVTDGKEEFKLKMD